MPFSVNLIKRLEAVEPPLRGALIALLEEVERQREVSITKKEFLEFAKTTEENFQKVWKTIGELAEAQKRTEIRLNELAEAQKKTEQRLDSLTEKVEALAEAQKRTEIKINELAEAQKRTEQRLDSLTEKVEALAEAQKKTEIRLNELAEAQKKTEIRLNELAEAQKRTEQRLDSLTEKVEALAEAQERTEIRLNELAEAQKRTEQRLDSLTEKVEALAEAQKRTEIKVNELAEAQKRTEVEIRKLGIGLRRTREQIGGLARSVAYALENEAFRKLPAFLKERYQIEVIDNIIRAEIEGEEINILGQVKKDGQEMMLVGEAVLKLDDRRKLKLLSDKVQLVKETYGKGVIPIIITHFAKKNILERAKNAGIIIVQSFEWH